MSTQSERRGGAVTTLGLMRRHFMILLVAGCATSRGSERVSRPELVGAGTISTEAPEFATSITPDGRTLFFNRASPDRSRLTIMEARLEGGTWTAARAVAFSGTHRDVDPFVAPDGSRLYFSSTRPTSPTDTVPDFNSWYVERVGEGWGPPIALEPPLNTASTDVFITSDRAGTLYFSSDRDGTGRTYRSGFANGRHEAPEVVPFDLNLATGAGNPAISPDGRLLIVTADRPGGSGGTDLYATCSTGAGWTPATSLGPAINSAFTDFAPSFSADGRTLFFTSERPGIVPGGGTGRPPGDIYRVAVSALPVSCPRP